MFFQKQPKSFYLAYLRSYSSLWRIFLGFFAIFIIDIFTHIFSPLKHFLLRCLFPVLEFFSSLENSLDFFQYMSLNARERAHFNHIQDQYDILKSDYFKLKTEVENLRDILKSPAPINSVATIGQIVAVHIAQTKKNISVNKGSNDGLKEGQIVISPQGLVGRIREIWPKYSLVETLLDKGLKIPAQCHETKEKGLIVRYNEELLAFKYLGTKPRIGEIVHTTHFQELYPENLKIGEVVRFEEDLALVKPCVDISRLNYVMILK